MVVASIACTTAPPTAETFVSDSVASVVSLTRLTENDPANAVLSCPAVAASAAVNAWMLPL